MIDKEIEEMIKKTVSSEIKKQMIDIVDNDEIFATVAQVSKRLEKTYLDLEATRDTLRKNIDEIHEINDIFKNMDLSVVEVDVKPVAKPVKKIYHPQPKEVMDNEEEVIEKENAVEPEIEEELEWLKEQDGNLEKGDTQIWRYGNHTLTVWTEGKKYFAQINEENPVTLWKQSDLEKIQKQIEKREQ